ncbi:MAG TPA: glycosyltransferase family 2 protein [Chitinophagaceae bacterium]|nr:glycosyltransferase family 2 protein [Chitinophagaceae bacterium]
MEKTGISPKVSIIMPTHNRASLITASIESIRNQTFSNWELIIVDDGSTDETAEIISQYKDERIHFYKTERTGKVGKIKNIGLEKSSGDYIAFNDSDDLWHPEKLGKQVAVLLEYPDAGFCLTGGYNFNIPGKPVNYFYRQSEGITYGNVFINCFRSQVAAFSQALLFKKECISLSGTFKEEKSFSDVDFIFNLAFHFKAVILYESLVYRRLHDNNYITPNWEKSNAEGIEIVNSFRENLPVAVYRNALFRIYINFGEKYLSFRQRKKAIRMFLKAWQYHPLSLMPIKKSVKALFYFLSGK